VSVASPSPTALLDSRQAVGGGRGGPEQTEGGVRLKAV